MHVFQTNTQGMSLVYSSFPPAPREQSDKAPCPKEAFTVRNVVGGGGCAIDRSVRQGQAHQQGVGVTAPQAVFHPVLQTVVNLKRQRTRQFLSPSTQSRLWPTAGWLRLAESTALIHVLSLWVVHEAEWKSRDFPLLLVDLRPSLKAPFCFLLQASGLLWLLAFLQWHSHSERHGGKPSSPLLVMQAAGVRAGKWVSTISAWWHWAPKEFSTSWADVPATEL